MAAITGAVVAAGATAYGANRQASAARGAANTAAAEQARQFDLARQDQRPWLEAGQNALGRLNAVNDGDYSGFMNSPDYQFAMDQGIRSLDRSAAARGGLFSGGADADRMQFASGLATQNLNNYTNRLSSIAGLGQNSAQSLGSLGANAAGNIGNARMAAGQAQGAGYAGMANSLGNLAGYLGGRLDNGGVWGGSGKPDIQIQPISRIQIPRGG